MKLNVRLKLDSALKKILTIQSWSLIEINFLRLPNLGLNISTVLVSLILHKLLSMYQTVELAILKFKHLI